jgi:general L-amino acid transport system permease protein
MTAEWGHTLPPDMMMGDLAHVMAAEQRHDQKLPPGKWIKRNLFNSVLNTLITIILGPIAVYLLYRAFRFVFVTGQWSPIEENLELFMIGLFPREERWRIIAQLLIMSAAIGMAIGLVGNRARVVAIETGQPRPPAGWRTYLASYWALGLFIITILAAFTSTIGPTLIVLGSLVLAALGYVITAKLPPGAIPFGWSAVALTGAVSFQMLSGTGGWAWIFSTAALVPAMGALSRTVPRAALLPITIAGALVGVVVLVLRFGWIGGAVAAVGAWAVISSLRGDRIDGARTGLLMLAGGAIFLIYDAVGLEGIDWQEWGGLHLNLVAASAAIVLACPLGMLLAIGRRSRLPAVRMISIVYIEFFRGAPLITFLLAASYFLPFFLGSSSELSQVTRAIAAITLFSAAYVAEIIRGGLNAVPSGQIEAGQAVGLSASKITRLIVMPQALRAVIPAMVGQFISLFKDTTLLTIISITEILDVRSLVHAQSAFRTIGIAETFVFVAFTFWAFSFTMSRESQRLERRLGVGTR